MKSVDDALGNCDPSFFGGNVHLTMTIASVVALLCTSLFIVGFAAFTDDPKSIQQVSWIHASTEFQSVTSNQYFGLFGIYTVLTASRQNKISTYVSYDNKQCGLSIATIDDITTTMCSKCAHAGQTAFYLVLVSFFLSAAVAISGMVRMLVLNTHGVKYLTILSCVFILFFSLAAFVNWSTNCYTHVQTEVVRDAPSGSLIHVYYAVGFNSIVTGFVFMVGVLFLHILTPSHSYDSQDMMNIYSASRSKKKNPLSISLQKESDDDSSNADKSGSHSYNGDDDSCMGKDVEAQSRLKRSVSSEPDFGCPSHLYGSDKSLVTENQI